MNPIISSALSLGNIPSLVSLRTEIPSVSFVPSEIIMPILPPLEYSVPSVYSILTPSTSLSIYQFISVWVEFHHQTHQPYDI